MSFQNNTAVDVYQNFVLSTALDSDFSSEDLADDMDGLQLTMQRVKIPGGGNLQFEIRSDDPDNPDYERKLVGVILYHHLANAYWPEGSEYDDNVPPFCQSFDGKQGYGEPGGVCAACAFNQFGSTANGSGKACKNMRQIYLRLCRPPAPQLFRHRGDRSETRGKWWLYLQCRHVPKGA